MLYFDWFFIKTNMNNLKPISGGTFLFRILGGISGGITGTAVMLMIYFITLSILPSQENDVPGITTFTLIAMLLLSTLTTNMVSSYLIMLADKNKYHDVRFTLTNVFVLNLVLFIFTTPLYLIASTETIQTVAAFHLLISAQMSAVLLDIFSGSEYSLIATYGVALGGITAFSIVSFIVIAATEQNSGVSTLLLFIAMPMVWGLIEFFKGISEIAYTKIATFYSSQNTDN